MHIVLPLPYHYCRTIERGMDVEEHMCQTKVLDQI
jgi:hypothetical protein